MSAQSAAEETETMSLREAIRSALREELLADDDVFIMGQDEEDGGSFEVTAGLHDEFGFERVRNTPISEAAQVGAGVGAAATGMRPVVNLSFADFIGVCFDQIMNQAGKTRYMFGGASEVPLTLRAIEGAGLNAAAQHSGTVHSLVAHLPGVKAVAPGTPAAAKGLMKSAIRSDDPVVFFENKTIYERHGPVPTDEEFTVPLGEASVEQEGEDVTVVATQRLLGESIAAARDVDADVEVIDPRSLYPLDTDTIADSLRKTGRLVVADEPALLRPPRRDRHPCHRGRVLEHRRPSSARRRPGHADSVRAVPGGRGRAGRRRRPPRHRADVLTGLPTRVLPVCVRTRQPVWRVTALPHPTPRPHRVHSRRPDRARRRDSSRGGATARCCPSRRRRWRRWPSRRRCRARALAGELDVVTLVSRRFCVHTRSWLASGEKCWHRTPAQ